LLDQDAIPDPGGRSVDPFVDGLSWETRVQKGLTVFYGKIYFHGYKRYDNCSAVSTFFLTSGKRGCNMFTMRQKSSPGKESEMLQGRVVGRLSESELRRFNPLYEVRKMLGATIFVLALILLLKLLDR
jgi:hypothetical protein